jgi:putative N6-adenine-specific DNA methylase
LPLCHFTCPDEKALYQEVQQVDWSQYIHQGDTIAVDANVYHPQLRHSLYVAQKTKDAICDQLRERYRWRPSVQVQNPDVQINIFIQDQQAVLSIDTSGAPLYKRGYRLKSVTAPLQESLAAALLRLARYRGEGTLCDPCCGSGTLLIEAAMIATHTPAGFYRKQWGFQHLPGFDRQSWSLFKRHYEDARKPLEKGLIYGFDQSHQAVAACQENIRNAGWGEAITVYQANLMTHSPSSSGYEPSFVICNPPYGQRLDEEESLKPLYEGIGDFFKQCCAKPARGFVLTGSPTLAKSIGLRPQRRHIVNNGGIESRLLEYDVY